jgi:hypothetical protein
MRELLRMRLISMGLIPRGSPKSAYFWWPYECHNAEARRNPDLAYGHRLSPMSHNVVDTHQLA